MAIDANITKTLANETGHSIELCKIALERSKNDVNAAKRLIDKWLQSPIVKNDDPGLVTAYYEKSAPAAVVVKLTSNDALVPTMADFKKLLKDIAVELAYCDDVYVEAVSIEKIAKKYDCLINTEFSRIEKTSPLSLLTTYTHRDNIGVIVETSVSNEDAFNNRLFRIFSHEIALHIAAFNPHSISANNISEEMLVSLKNKFQKELMETIKPMAIWPDVIKGKIAKWAENNTLLNQIFIKNDKETVNSVKSSLEKTIGSEIVINQFKRFSLEKNGSLVNI